MKRYPGFIIYCIVGVRCHPYINTVIVVDYIKFSSFVAYLLLVVLFGLLGFYLFWFDDLICKVCQCFAYKI
jgi:hypothetical protein